MKTTRAIQGLLGGSAALLSGCGTLEGERGWGEDAGYPVQWQRVKTAAKNAVLDPMTWVPVAGAAVFAIDDWDHEVSEWASEKNPVFGSVNQAEDYSDYVKDVMFAETFLTAALTPSGDEFKDWSLAKLRGMAVEGVAFVATSSTTSELKDLVGRERPNKSNDKSMPSGHASSAFAASGLSNRNLDSIEMNDTLRTSLKAANIGLASSVAWTRVEGKKHYPSDVLVGAALGNVISVFIHDAFMNLPEGEEEKVGIYIEPSPQGVWAAISFKF